MSCTDILQTVAVWGLFIVAVVTVCYGIKQYEGYKAEKRPYVSLMGITAKSNLSKNNLVRVPEYDKNDKKKYDSLTTEERKLCGKTISADIILKSKSFLKNELEEILFDMHFKNTGPVGAVNGQIKYTVIVLHEDKPLTQLWKNVEKAAEGNKDIIQFIADNIALNPQQEQTYSFMIHRSQIKNVEKFFILCDVRYDSVKKKQPGVVRIYRILNLYRVWHPKAYTMVYYSNLIKSEIDDKD